MAKKLAGYRKKLLIGTAGATAATPLLNVQDIDIDHMPEYADTSDRGDGDSVPNADRVEVSRDCKISFSVVAKESDTNLVTMCAAAMNKTETALAFKVTDPILGTEFDGDVFLKLKDTAKLKGAQLYEFEAIPTTVGGRPWVLYGT